MFTGAYSSEFGQTWLRTTDPFVRSVIGDEEITDEEWEQVVDRLAACFEENGMTISDYDQSTGYAISIGSHTGDEANEIAAQCEESSGESAVGRLRIGLQRNPENRDIDEIMFECLVRVEAVPADYTLEEYRRDNPDYAFPFITSRADSDELYDRCADAPLTATPLDDGVGVGDR